jgi:hypothetical protein
MKKGNYLKNYKLNVVFTFVFFIWISAALNAANYVKVATIGNRLPVLNKTKGMQIMVDQVKEFWRNELEQVLPDKPDLIVLPEICDSPGGLSKEEQSDYYRIRKNQVLDFFASVAKENHCYIVYGTMREQEDGILRNSSIMLGRNGKVAGIYNKKFPTIGEIENGVVPGDEAPVFECDFGKVAFAICFDLNFTELCHEYASKKPDIIVFSSLYHGGLMQSYWAYQCRSFFVGAMGKREIPSEIRNPQGQVVASNTNYFDYAVTTINLDCKLAHLDYNWGNLKALKKKYGDAVTISDPGKVGSVLITSEHKNISAEEMIKEFNIELLDDYFNRSREVRLKSGKIQ